MKLERTQPTTESYIHSKYVSKATFIPFIGKQTGEKEGRSNGDEWLKRRRRRGSPS
jgi:hypothetical protein